MKIEHIYGPKDDNNKFVTWLINEFLSHKQEIKLTKGGQKRDFIYVEDIAEIIFHIFQSGISNDLYNVGTGEAHSFNELAELVIAFSGITGKIEYIDMPDSIKECYQNYTAAHIKNIVKKGCQ